MAVSRDYALSEVNALSWGINIPRTSASRTRQKTSFSAKWPLNPPDYGGANPQRMRQPKWGNCDSKIRGNAGTEIKSRKWSETSVLFGPYRMVS